MSRAFSLFYQKRDRNIIKAEPDPHAPATFLKLFLFLSMPIFLLWEITAPCSVFP